MEVFCPGYGYCPHYNVENDHRKRSHSKMLSRVERFENDAFWKRCYTLNAHGQMNSTDAHFNISAREIGAKLKPHGSVCHPFWILTVEWSGARSCLFWWCHRFQIASFSPSSLENSIVFKSLHSGECFRIAPFLVIVFGVVVWTIALSGAKLLRFRLKLDWCGRGLIVR